MENVNTREMHSISDPMLKVGHAQVKDMDTGTSILHTVASRYIYSTPLPGRGWKFQIYAHENEECL